MKVDKIETRLDPMEPAISKPLDLKSARESNVATQSVTDLKAKEQLDPLKEKRDAPKNTVDNPNFAAFEKEKIESTIYQLFFLREVRKQAIEMDIVKRNELREYIKNMYVKDDSKSYFMSQMNEQRLRMLFTWLDRFWNEKKFRHLREWANIQYKDLQQMKRDAFMYVLKFERLVATRKSELERLKPRVNLLEERREERAEDLARLKLDKMKEKIIIKFDDRQRMAEYMISSTALEKIDSHRRVENLIKTDLFKDKDRSRALRKVD
jgi:hypothetical protein